MSAAAAPARTPPIRHRRRALGAALAMLALLGPAAQLASASCKTALPDASLRPLDESADSDPVQAATRAEAARSRLAPGSRLQRAEYAAISADAYDTIGDDARARAAIADGRADLAASDAGGAVRDGLLLRLALTEADTAETEADITTSLSALRDWQARVEPRSLGHACLLLVRGRVEGRLGQHESAAKDGLQAYMLAAMLNAEDARAEAGYQLATTYRRAGLYADALQMAEEVLAYTRRKDQQAAYANMLWEKAQIVADAGRPGDALPAIAESRRISMDLHDAVGVAFADMEECRELVVLKRFNEAEPICRRSESALRVARRPDHAAAAADFLARIELARGRTGAAIAGLARELVDGGQHVPPNFLPAMYRDYADALARVGRAGEALDALQNSLQLTELADERRRSLAVALLNAKEQADHYQRDREVLRQQIENQRDQARSRELAQRLSVALAFAAAALAALLGYLLVTTRRHARDLQRQQAILRATAENSPDALALLDRSGRIRYANRALFGGDDASAGWPVAEQAPEEARARLRAAVEDLIGQRRSISLEVHAPRPDGAHQFEVRGVPIVQHGELIGATLRSSDVTERRKLEREVLDVAARERHRLSSDLHEGLGQELTGVALQLSAMGNAIARGRGDIADLLREARAQVDRAIATARDLAHGMSPVQIERGSLSLALERLARDVSRRLGIPTHFRATPTDIRAAEDVSDHLYRITVEAITNAARHGECRSISIVLERPADGLVLSISDDGRGLPPGHHEETGLGLRMMRYRARLLGGELQVESLPGAGTRIRVAVPCHAAEAA